jgi:hypothetical protein
MKTRIAEYRAIAHKEKLEELGVKSAVQGIYKGVSKVKDKISDYKLNRKIKKDIKKDKKSDNRWGDKIKSYITGKSKFDNMSATEIAQHAIRMKDGNEQQALQYVRDQIERLSSNKEADHKKAISNLEKAAKGLEAAVELGKDEKGNYVRAGSSYAYKAKVAAGKATDADHEAHKDKLKKKMNKKRDDDYDDDDYDDYDDYDKAHKKKLELKKKQDSKNKNSKYKDKDDDNYDDDDDFFFKKLDKKKKDTETKDKSKENKIKIDKAQLENDKKTLTKLLINYITGKNLSYDESESLHDLNAKYNNAFNDLFKKVGLDLEDLKKKKKTKELSRSFEQDFEKSEEKKNGEVWKTKEGIFAAKHDGKVMYFAGEEEAKAFSASGKLPSVPNNKKQINLDSLSDEDLKHEQIRLITKIHSDESMTKEEQALLISQAANISMEVKKRQDKKDKHNHNIEMQSNPEYRAEVERIERENPEKSKEEIIKELQKKDREETQMVGQLNAHLKENKEITLFRHEVNKYLKLIS